MSCAAGTLEQSVLSLEYVQVPVSITVNCVPYDPTGDVVEFAFMPVGTDPAPADFKFGIWVACGVPLQFTAEILVGPGGTFVLPVGTYEIWIRIVDTPEIPVRSVGFLAIT